MTRLIHVVAQYRPVIGGAQHYCALLTEALVERGLDARVLTSRLSDRGTWLNDLPSEEVIDAVRVRRFQALKRGRVTWRVFHWCRKRHASHPRLLLEMGLMLAEGPVAPELPLALLASPRGTLVHLFGVYSALVGQAFVAARLARLPIVVTPFIHTTPPIGLNMLWKRRVLRGADHVIAMTPSEKTYLECELGLAPSRVSVVSPGLRPSDYPVLDKPECRRRLGLPDQAFVVLFIGRREPHKGLQTLLAAFRALRDCCSRTCRLVLVGPVVANSGGACLQDEADPDVVDLGAADHATKLQALNACDCLAFPSTSESFGIVILEAWAVARPVVVTRLPPIEDIVADGDDGLLVDVGSVQQLAAALKRLCDDLPTAATMGERGRLKFLSSYTTATMADSVLSIYDSLARVS